MLINVVIKGLSHDLKKISLVDLNRNFINHHQPLHLNILDIIYIIITTYRSTVV